jgi:hypothetical protein
VLLSFLADGNRKIGILMLNAFVGWYQEKQAGDIVEQLKAGIAMKATVGSYPPDMYQSAFNTSSHIRWFAGGTSRKSPPAR